MAARNLRQRIEELTVVADIASAMLSPFGSITQLSSNPGRGSAFTPTLETA
ncbi:MAG: hypothetical protein ABSG65_22870 [Bryobacteraceae bacterium]|jgi:hypothetical protein